MALTEAQQEAAELATALIDFATGIGWDVAKKGVNQSYAWAHLTHPWHEGLQVFYSVDPETTDDKFIYGSVAVPLEALKPIIKSISRGHLRDTLPQGAQEQQWEVDVIKAIQSAELAPVPPTSAAHSAAHPDAVPPTEPSAAHPVPPTVEEAERAAHERASAAHTQEAVPPIVGSAAHIGEDGNFTTSPTAHAEMRAQKLSAAHQEDAMPPISDELEEADRRWCRDEAKAHLEQAGQPASQLDTIAAVEAQQAMGAKRNWSAVASPLTNDELLVQVPGRTITFRNRQSGRLEQTTVCTTKEAKRYLPKITPEGFDADEVGEDLRILHFLELGAGFRSIAVSQITEIN